MGCIKSKTKVVINYDKRNSEALTASSDNAVIENKLLSVVPNNSKHTSSSNPIVKIVTETEGHGDSFQKELKERINSLILKQRTDDKMSTVANC